MAGYIEVVSGRKKQINTIVQTTGVAEADMIVATNSEGRLDNTLHSIIKNLTASEALNAGDFVNIWGDGGTPKVRKANAEFNYSVDGFVKVATPINTQVDVYFEGINNFFMGLTIGKPHFLSSTPGFPSNVPSVTDGYTYQKLGRAISGSELLVQLGEPIRMSDAGDIIIIDNTTGQLKENDNSSPVEIGDVVFTGAFSLGPALSPPAITANTANLIISGIDSVSIIRLSSTGNFSLDGLEPPSGGTSSVILYVFNVGTNNITLKDQSASASTGNQFFMGANKTIQPNEGLILAYDTVDTVWRISGIAI